MAITNYGELKTAVANWLERDDLTSRIPEFIAIAEARHRRDIRNRSMVSRGRATLSSGEQYLALPTGYLAMREMTLITNPISPVRQVSPSALRREVQEVSAGKPEFFAVHEEIEFNRPAGSDYTVEMLYWKSFSSLSDTITSNQLLTDHPDIYLYSSLAAASPFLADDERIQLWAQLYAEAVQALNLADKKDQWSQGLLASTPRVVAY